MEDAECLPENSPLNFYLQDIGYSDFQITKNPKPSAASLRFDASKSNSKWINAECIDEEVIDEIGILISTQMLFEEDISNVEKLLSNFKVVKNGMMKNMFQGVFGLAVIFVGLCLYWLIGGYAFLIVSVFYAYNAADYLTRKHFTQNRLRKLASILQNNFFLLKRTVKFIDENSKFGELNKAKLNDVTDKFEDGFSVYKNFKCDILISINEMISILTKSTQKLIKQFPLYDYMENPEYYVCNNFDKKSYESVDVSKLYQIYLLVQSEFLKRLVLSLVPNINLSSKNNNNNFKELNKILTETCINLLKIKNKFNKKFKFIFFNGIHYPNSKVEFKLPVKSRISCINYSEEFASNIHDTSNAFQNLLIKSRILEENLKGEKFPEGIENDLVNMQNELETCQRNLADSFILLKKANATTNKQHNVTIKQEDVGKFDEESEKVEIGYSDLDPRLEDEIYEACFTDEKLGSDFSNIDDWDFEDRLKKKLEKEYSKKVIEELKTKIVERALRWEKREVEFLKKKKNVKENNLEENEIKKEGVTNLVYENNHNMSISDSKSESEDITNDQLKLQIDKLSDKCQKKHNFEISPMEHENEIDSLRSDIINKNIIQEELKNEDESKSAFEEPQCIGGINKKFLSDINQARRRILKISETNEEEFYCSSSYEDSDELE